MSIINNFTSVLSKKKNFSTKAFLVSFFIYLPLLLLIALPEGMDTLIIPYSGSHAQCEGAVDNCKYVSNLKASSTAKDYLQFFSYGGDPGSYVRGGMILAGKPIGDLKNLSSLSILERLKLINIIGLGMWPPGMFMMNSIPLKISSAIPIGLYQILLASILWSLVFSFFSSLLSKRNILFTLLPLVLLFFPIFNKYLLRYGVMYSETYGIAFLIFGFSLLISAFSDVIIKKRTMIFAGFCFAIASLFRSQVFLVTVGLCAIFLFYSLIYFKQRNDIKILHCTLLFVLSFAVPLGTYMKINKGALFRVPLAWQLPFTVEQFPNAGARNFLAHGGIRAACEVDLEKCDAIRKKVENENYFRNAQKEVIKAFVFHPIKFSMYKLPIAYKYWIGDSTYTGIDTPEGYTWNNFFILILFIACLLYMTMNKLWLLLAFSVSTLTAVLGPPFLIHFEARYFYILKTFILFLPFLIYLMKSSQVQEQLSKEKESKEKFNYETSLQLQ